MLELKTRSRDSDMHTLTRDTTQPDQIRYPWPGSISAGLYHNKSL